MPFSGRAKTIARVSLLISIALILWIFEEMIPYPFPFLKLGLGNIVVVIALYSMGFRYAFIVSVSRVVLGALILGRLFSPIFIFSISGAVLSVLAMSLLWKLKVFSIIGVSIGGAFIHNIAQLSIAALLFYSLKSMLYFTPLLGLSSIVGGSIVAFIAYSSLTRIPAMVSRK